MPFPVDVQVDREFLRPRRMRRNDRLGIDRFDVGAEVIGSKGGVAQHPLRRQAVDQCLSLGDVIALASREEVAHRQAETAHRQVNFAGQAAARAADGLILSPPFAPAPCWCTRTMVESTIRYSKSGSSASAAKMRCQTPLSLQRLKRTNTLFHLPKMLGRSRHGEPVRAIQRTASTNIRLFAPVPPGSSGLPTHSFSIRAHCRLLRTSRIRSFKTASS